MLMWTSAVVSVAGLAAVGVSGSSVSSVQTDVNGARFEEKQPLEWKERATVVGGAALSVDRSQVGQEILGFGSALSEAAAYNHGSLSKASAAKLVEAVWAPPPAGNGYSLGRMHMGSSDFARSSYSLAETAGDFALEHFDDGLARDSEYVLPLGRAALEAAGGPESLRLFFSPWSPPAWLKANGNMINSSHPNGMIDGDEARVTYANYFVRFARALKAAGVPAWGATLQNEPLMVMKTGHKEYESCAFTVESQGELLVAIGEILEAETDESVKHLQLFGYDFNRNQMGEWAAGLQSGPGAKYLAGVTHHWYEWGGSLHLDKIEALPQGMLSFGAEACLIKKGIAASSGAGGSSPPWGTLLATDGVAAGTAQAPSSDTVRYTYASGELYLLDVVGTLRAGSAGWVDWNAFLNYTGGWNHLGRNDIGAPVLVDWPTDSIYLQAPYYYVGHISRYVRPGARRVACSGQGVANTAAEHDVVKEHIKPQIYEDGTEPEGAVPLVAGCFVAEDGSSASVVVMNANSESVDFTLIDVSLGSVSVSLDPHSVRTFTYDTAAADLLV